jgi:hypothetical protein
MLINQPTQQGQIGTWDWAFKRCLIGLRMCQLGFKQAIKTE